MPAAKKPNRYPGVARRCGCVDPDEKERTGRKVKLGSRCPKLADFRHGRWHWRAELGAGVDPETGQWQARRRPSGHADTATAAKDARQAAIDACKEADRVKATEPVVETTVRQALDAAMEAKRVKGLAHGTLVLYRGHLDNHVLPRLGDLPVRELDARTLRGRYAEIPAENAARTEAGRQTVGVATVHAVHRTVRALLTVCVKDGVLPFNPAKDLDVEVPRRKPARTWDAETAGRFLDHVDEHDDELRALWYLALDAGSRRSEGCGLKWPYLDLATGAFEIPAEPGATLVVVRSRPETSRPKTESSARTGVVSAATLEALKRHRKKQAEARLAAGEAWSNPEGYVFTRADGTPWHPEAVSRRFKRLVARAGLPYIPLKNLRHSSATIGLDSGAEDLEDVSRRLGHSSTTITRRFYVGRTSSRAAAQSEARAAAIPRRTPPHHAPHPPRSDSGGTVTAI